MTSLLMFPPISKKDSSVRDVKNVSTSLSTYQLQDDWNFWLVSMHIINMCITQEIELLTSGLTKFKRMSGSKTMK